MKKWLLVPAMLLSGIAILLAIAVGQWEVVAPRADAELEAQYETHLSPTGHAGHRAPAAAS